MCGGERLHDGAAHVVKKEKRGVYKLCMYMVRTEHGMPCFSA